MNGQTLQALRGFLFFSVPEAARIIAQVQERTWRYWESGDALIADDVAKKIQMMIAFREFLVDNAKIQIQIVKSKFGQDAQLSLTYYATLEDFMTQDSVEPIHWRPHCSAMAYLASQGMTLVRFNAVEYRHWLGIRTDDSSMRAEWAISKGIN